MIKTILDVFFSDRKWYRKKVGGKWICWQLDPTIGTQIWVRGDEPKRPEYRGSPIIEDYTKKEENNV